MGDITKQITVFLTPQFETKRFKLSFHYNEKEYTTEFTAKHTTQEIEVNNPCITMTYEYATNSMIGKIESDSETNRCFNPILATNARDKPGKRTTAADVLQILKTKLGLAFPVEIPITLFDGAQKDAIMIAPFNILRGGDAFYEKYGYKSDIINRIKEGIRQFKWRDLTDEQKGHISGATGKTYDATESLVEIMKTIPWDKEKKYLSENENNRLSYRVLRLFAPTFGLTFEDMNQFSVDSVWKFTLDQSDERWIKSNEDLVFTGFEEIRSGGARKRRKTVRRRSLRKSKEKRRPY